MLLGTVIVWIFCSAHQLFLWLQAGSVGGGTTPQKLIEASRGASFNEVLARCLSLGSESASPAIKAAAGDEQIIAPFIPIDTTSLGEPPTTHAPYVCLCFSCTFNSVRLPLVCMLDLIGAHPICGQVATVSQIACAVEGPKCIWCESSA